MIEILLAIQIIYSTPSDITFFCGTGISACTNPISHVIYTSNKDEFTLYHEIGHNLYWDNKPVDNGIFSEQQRIADDFAFYIFSKKYPNEYIDDLKYWTYKSFYEKTIKKERDILFKNTCNDECILLIKQKYNGK